MKPTADRSLCPALSADVESWPFFTGRGLDSESSIYVIGSRTVDRYITVPASKLDLVQRILSFFDGQHSLEWIANWFLENEGKKVDVYQLYERMAAAQLLVSSDSRMLPPGYQVSEWSIPLFNVPVDWLFRRTAGWNTRWLPAFLGFSAVLFAAGVVCLVKLHFFTTVFQYTLYGSGVFLYVAFLVGSFLVHEMAHGIAASWFGLTARRFSASFYLGFIPLIHLRIGGLYTLSRRRRIAVWMAGVWCNFLLASAGAVALTFFPAHMGPSVRYFVSQATVANITMGIFNLFPFMPTDGYFILSTLLRTYNVRQQAWLQFLDLTRLRWSHVSWFAVAYLLLSGLTILVLLQRLLAALITTPLKSPAGVFNAGLILIPLFLFLWKSVFRRAARARGQKGNAMGSLIAWVRTRWIPVSAISLLGAASTALYLSLQSCAARLGACQGPECSLLRASSCSQAFGQNLLVYLLACFAGVCVLLLLRLALGRRLAVVVNSAFMLLSVAGLITAARMAFIETGWLGFRCPMCVAATGALTAVFVLGAAGSLWRSGRGVTALLLAAWVVLGIPSFLFLLREGAVPSVKHASASLSGQPPALTASGHYTLGTATPKLQIVEFADLQCPACRDQQENMDAFLGRYGDKVQFVFYHYPLNRHPLARQAAEVAECAGAQNKFWEAVHLFYTEQNTLSSAAMLTVADKLGLDKIAYQNCLSSGEMAGRIARDVARGDAIGLTGLPTILVGDLKITGEIAPSKFSEIVELGVQGQRPNAVAPAGVGCAANEPAITSLSPREASSLLAQSRARIRFIDLRPAADFDRERIPGAVSLSRGISSQQWQKLKTTELLVLYDAGAETAQSACAITDPNESLNGAKNALVHHGVVGNQVKLLTGGLMGWESDGLTVDRPSPRSGSTRTQSGGN
jgi:putative peptide zinc metalloprotease protein